MKKVLIAGILTLPTMAFAALTALNNLAIGIGTVVTTLIPIVMGLAVLVFFWGLVKYIANADDEGAKESGKNLMIWGMVALFVMVALWGILGFVQTELGINGTITNPPPPAFQVPTVR